MSHRHALIVLQGRYCVNSHCHVVRALQRHRRLGADQASRHHRARPARSGRYASPPRRRYRGSGTIGTRSSRPSDTTFSATRDPNPRRIGACQSRAQPTVSRLHASRRIGSQPQALSRLGSRQLSQGTKRVQPSKNASRHRRVVAIRKLMHAELEHRLGFDHARKRARAGDHCTERIRVGADELGIDIGPPCQR